MTFSQSFIEKLHVVQLGVTNYDIGVARIFSGEVHYFFSRKVDAIF